MQYDTGKVGELYWKTYEGDCRKIMSKEMLVNSVDCIVTSPPYWQRRSYGEVPHQDGNVGTWSYSSSTKVQENEIGNGCTYEQYINDLEEVIEGCYEILKENKFMFINIGNKHKDKELMDYSHDIIRSAKEKGFIHCETIIWLKKNPQPPGRYKGLYLGNAWEYILMFAKGKNYKIYDEQYLNTKSHYICTNCKKDNYMELEAHPNYIYSNIGCFGKKDKLLHSHPAVFPIDIPKFCISLATREEEVVFDPFVGSGTSLQAALQLGRNAIGCELIPSLYKNLVENMNRLIRQN